ncbi:MAG TPA: cation:proton antiporter [Nitrososphaeraceae archaeon]|jgi:CPA2 family monovalent cation:H+ antiporter-2|nr:cation:proton antiporter [Nitrososphaeraceae archaeon]
MDIFLPSVVFNALSFTNLGSSEFIVQDFAVIMVMAAVMLFITHKLKQSMVVGYLLAGMIIGPYTPPFSLIKNVETINVFAELGIIVLLFVIGIEFPIAKLRQIGRISMIVGLTESIGTMLITFFVAQNLGFTVFDSMFLALAMSITSTVVTIKILEEMGKIKERSSILILGVLIVEDIIAVTTLAILQSIASASGTDDISIISISISIAIAIVFIGTILILGSRFLPNLIDKIGKTNDYALLLIVIMGLAFGLSFIANILGLSVVIGAFLAGVLVAESKSATVAKVITIPLRDIFSALFFISIGALVNISVIPMFIIPAMILILTAFASKLLLVLAVLAKSKFDNIDRLKAGLGLASAKGEMSLVIAKGGQDVGAITSSVLPILSVVTIITAFASPYIIRFAHNIKSTKTEYKGDDEVKTNID